MPTPDPPSASPLSPFMRWLIYIAGAVWTACYAAAKLGYVLPPYMEIIDAGVVVLALNLAASNTPRTTRGSDPVP